MKESPTNQEITNKLTISDIYTNLYSHLTLPFYLSFPLSFMPIPLTVIYKSVFFSVNSYYLLDYMQCYYTRDLVTIEFIDSWYFNQVEYMRYNSTTDRYTGYTVYGARLAEVMNLNPQSSLRHMVDLFCKDSSDRYASNVLKKGVNSF